MLISTDTIWLGLLGNPVGHSLSPLMHNAALQHLGINAIYLPFTVPGERIGDAVRAIPALNLRGVNVTIPFKEAVIPFLDELSPGARACRAVNVIANQQGKLVGYNTDGQGFIAALQEAKAAVPENVLILGAGGAARALVFALAEEGAKTFYLLDREEYRARELARALAGYYQGVKAQPLPRGKAAAATAPPRAKDRARFRAMYREPLILAPLFKPQGANRSRRPSAMR